MKKTLFCMASFLLLGTASIQAQSLVLKKKYGSNWQNETVSHVNKPNGNMYRLREEIQCNDLPLIPRVENADQKMILIISERTKTGWMALYRNPLGASKYNFIAVFYNDEKDPVASVDLCEISKTYNCEVQDIRYDANTGDLFFNMACPSYASGVNGKGSKLFCYNMNSETMKWETPYLTSNDILIFNDKYVFCSYGFTSEKDYIFMLDRNTGKIYSKLPTTKKVEYIEIQQKNGKDLLYAVDYNDHLYVYTISDTTVKTTTTAKKPVAKKTTTAKK